MALAGLEPANRQHHERAPQAVKRADIRAIHIGTESCAINARMDDDNAVIREAETGENALRIAGIGDDHFSSTEYPPHRRSQVARLGHEGEILPVRPTHESRSSAQSREASRDTLRQDPAAVNDRRHNHPGSDVPNGETVPHVSRQAPWIGDSPARISEPAAKDSGRALDLFVSHAIVGEHGQRDSFDSRIDIREEDRTPSYGGWVQLGDEEYWHGLRRESRDIARRHRPL
jgi:hypothetical protein